MHKISYFDLNTKFAISLILINSISGMLYFSGSAFFGILAGKALPLLMNLPLFVYLFINVNAFKLKFYNFFDFIILLYTTYLLINAVYGLFIGNSLYKVLADLFRYLIIPIVYIYSKQSFTLKNSTIKYFFIVIIFTQLLSFFMFMLMILGGRFTRYSLSTVLMIIYFVFWDEKFNLFFRFLIYIFFLLSIFLTYTRFGLVTTLLTFIYFLFFYKNRGQRIKAIGLILCVIILVFALLNAIPFLENYYKLVSQRFLMTFETIENYLSSGLQSTTSYNDTLEERVLETLYSNYRLSSFNSDIIKILGAGLGAEYVDYRGEVTGQIHYGPQRDIFKVGYIGLILSNLMYIYFIIYYFLKRKQDKKNKALFIFFLVEYLAYFSYWNFFSYTHLILIIILSQSALPEPNR